MEPAGLTPLEKKQYARVLREDQLRRQAEEQEAFRNRLKEAKAIEKEQRKERRAAELRRRVLLAAQEKLQKGEDCQDGDEEEKDEEEEEVVLTKKEMKKLAKKAKAIELKAKVEFCEDGTVITGESAYVAEKNERYEAREAAKKMMRERKLAKKNKGKSLEDKEETSEGAVVTEAMPKPAAVQRPFEWYVKDQLLIDPEADTAELVEMWATLDIEAKAPFNAKGQADKVRVRREMEEWYAATEGVSTSKTGKGPTAPSKARQEKKKKGKGKRRGKKGGNTDSD